MLNNLGEDLFLEVCRFLSGVDCCKLRLVCNEFASIIDDSVISRQCGTEDYKVAPIKYLETYIPQNLIQVLRVRSDYCALVYAKIADVDRRNVRIAEELTNSLLNAMRQVVIYKAFPASAFSLIRFNYDIVSSAIKYGCYDMVSYFVQGCFPPEMMTQRINLVMNILMLSCDVGAEPVFLGLWNEYVGQLNPNWNDDIIVLAVALYKRHKLMARVVTHPSYRPIGNDAFIDYDDVNDEIGRSQGELRDIIGETPRSPRVPLNILTENKKWW